MGMQLTPDMLRKYIKDTAQMNKVFAGVEFEDSDYQSAVFWGQAKVKGIPPFMNNFPYTQIPLEVQRIGALAALFEMAALSDGRNASNLSEQGIPVPVGENAALYERWAEKYEQKFNKAVHEVKKAQNMMNAFQFQGGVYRGIDNGM